MFFQVLGDPGVRNGDEWYPVSAGKQRAVFCVLALSANRTVAQSALVDAIWGGRIPKHPDAALHIIVSRLRRAMGPAAVRLVSAAAGYRLDVAAEELDYTVARTEFVRGRTLLHDNEPQRAAAVLSHVLADWPENALDDLADFPFYRGAHSELSELRAIVEELHNEALLAAGRHLEVVATIATQITAHPWREALRRQRMVALYRSGRQVDALREFDDFREQLVEQLGIEPTDDLRDTYFRILDHDAALRLPNNGVPAPLPAWTAISMPFVGRGDEEDLVFERLTRVGQGERRMVLIEGEPGIGKTRLMLEVARRMSNDTILIPATGNDATRGTVLSLASSLARASAELGDDELRLCLGRWPNEIAAIAPAIARRLPFLEAPPEIDENLRAARLRESLASWIAALSLRAPVVLLIDDLHRAGPALFKFLGLLFAQHRHQRLLVLATARTETVGNSSKLNQFLACLEPFDCLDRLPLTGLAEGSVALLLTQLGVAAPTAEAQSLCELTGGHPFYIGELLQSEGWQQTIPASVCDFVRSRARDLGLPEMQMLECAAGFSTSFDVALLAEVAEVTSTVATMLLNRAVDAGFVRPTGTATFFFVHELTRRALLETIEPEHAERLHRRIALALEARCEPAAVLALQWRQLSDERARARTYQCARNAARDALRDFEPETAAVWLQLAVESATSAIDEGHARLALAEAQYQASDPQCAASLRTAIAQARDREDDELLVACASTWAPIWTSTPPLETDERVRLLSDAAAVAGDDARGVVSARLATELAHVGDHDRARALAAEALTATRHGAPRVARVEVALRYVHTMWSPHSLAERRSILRDLVSEVPVGDVVNRCSVLAFVAATATEAGDLADADEALTEMLLLAEDHTMGVLEVNACTSRAWRAALAGELDRATELASQAWALALRDGDGRAADGATVQLACLLWQRGRVADLEPYTRLDPRPTLASRLMHARCLAAGEVTEAARAAFAGVTAAELRDLPHDMFWSSTLIAVAEAAFMLDLPELGASVHELLEPFRHQLAFANFAVAPIAYGAGLAAAASRRIDHESLFADALAVCARLQAPVLRARTEIAFAIATRISAVTPDRIARIRAMADDARAVCNECRLTDLAADLDVAAWRLH